MESRGGKLLLIALLVSLIGLIIYTGRAAILLL